MGQFWMATALFVCLGLTPLVVAFALNRRDAGKGTHGEGR